MFVIIKQLFLYLKKLSHKINFYIVFLCSIPSHYDTKKLIKLNLKYYTYKNVYLPLIRLINFVNFLTTIIQKNFIKAQRIFQKFLL